VKACAIHASIVCGGMLASVNSMNSINIEKVQKRATKLVI